MLVIEAPNVHCALPKGIGLLQRVGFETSSRNGGVLVAPSPVTTTYNHPEQRVLYWPARDANPFLHFFESLWMLAGRNDLAFLQNFTKNFDQFSDDGDTLHGAYGWRWRSHWDKWGAKDQLLMVINLLKAYPNSRRAVLQMWDPDEDLYVSEDPGLSSRDVCCNTNCYVWINQGKLDMTVCCRSNDIIWGCYGANAVHFSMLQEFLATSIGVPVGRMYQISNNFHAYFTTLKKVKHLSNGEQYNPYLGAEVYNYSIMLPGVDPTAWLDQVENFVDDPNHHLTTVNPFLTSVAGPLWAAHYAYKAGDWTSALELAKTCGANDWRRAALEWLLRRKVKEVG